MSIQLLGGMAKGFSLDVPSGDATRPTSIMLRRKLFDARQSLAGFIFVDLFAGTGAVGFEAISRGADQLFLSETNKNAQRTLKVNVEKFRAKYKDSVIQVSPLPAKRFLESFSPKFEIYESNIILYIDPPYEQHELYFDTVKSIPAHFKGEIWFESDRQKGPSEELLLASIPKIQDFRRYDQGTNFVIMAKF